MDYDGTLPAPQFFWFFFGRGNTRLAFRTYAYRRFFRPIIRILFWNYDPIDSLKLLYSLISSLTYGYFIIELFFVSHPCVAHYLKYYKYVYVFWTFFIHFSGVYLLLVL